MTPRPPFDPRRDLRVVVHDLGPVTVYRPDAQGAPTPRQERRRAMSVFIDGEERIDYGLVIAGSDPLVAMRSCPCCELYECELIEGYAASVRRSGPYVLWLTAWGESHAFDVDRYREAFGPVDGLEAPGPRDWQVLGQETLPAGEYAGPDGRLHAFDVAAAPDTPLARLAAWQGQPRPDLEPVAPPAAAIELASRSPGAPSLWIAAHPDPDGRRAAYLPEVFWLPVWLKSPEVDALAAAVLERP